MTPGNLAFGLRGHRLDQRGADRHGGQPGHLRPRRSPRSATSGAFSETNNCGSSLAAGASCTASVKFTPTAGGAQTGELAITNSATATPIGATLSGTGVTSTTNLALSATMTASSVESGFRPSNANDGNTSTYWESIDGGAYPQTLTANLGQSTTLGSVTLDLPPATAWTTRTETLSVLGSTNGSTYTTLVPLGQLHVQPVHRQHGQLQPAVRNERPVPAAVLHRQHRLDRGAAGRVRDLPGQRHLRRQRLR